MASVLDSKATRLIYRYADLAAKWETAVKARGADSDSADRAWGEAEAASHDLTEYLLSTAVTATFGVKIRDGIRIRAAHDAGASRRRPARKRATTRRKR